MLKLPKTIKRKKLNWGIAGLGSFAEHAFMPALFLIPAAKLHSVFSHDINRAKSFGDNLAHTNILTIMMHFYARG